MDETIPITKKIEILTAENTQLRRLLEESEKECERINNEAKVETNRIRQLLNIMIPILQESKYTRDVQSTQCSMTVTANPNEFISFHNIDVALEEFMEKLNEDYAKNQEQEQLTKQIDMTASKLKTQSIFYQSKLESLLKQKSELEDTINDMLAQRKVAECHLSSTFAEPAFMRTLDKFM